MQPQDLDQPPAPTGSGMQPPAAPGPLQPAQAPQPYTPPASNPEPTPPRTETTPPSYGPNPYNDDDDDTKGGNRTRTVLIIAGIVLVLLVIGTIVALVLASGDKKPGTNSTRQPAAGNEAAANLTTNPQFFYTQLDTGKQNPVLYYVDALTGKQVKQTITLNDSVVGDAAYRRLTGGGSDTNQPLQVTADGKTIAYATVTYEATAASGPGQAQIVPGSFAISAGNRTGAHQPILAGKDADRIADWRLSADGKYVYYIETPDNSNKAGYTEAALYSINVATGQNKKLDDVAYVSDHTHSQLFEVTSKKEIRFYSSLADGLYQTTYDLVTEDTAHDLIVGSNQYSFGGFGQLSPNGEHLMYTGNPDGKKVVVYRIGTSTGEVQTIFDAADNRIAYSTWGWSADSKKILVTTYAYGAGQDQQDFKHQLVSYDVTTNKQTKLAETTGPGSPDANQTSKSYAYPQWSGNQKYITYIQDEKLSVYDVTSGKVTLPSAPLKQLLDSDSAWGWVQIPTEE
jgi:hypothetical protein